MHGGRHAARFSHTKFFVRSYNRRSFMSASQTRYRTLRALPQVLLCALSTLTQSFFLNERNTCSYQDVFLRGMTNPLLSQDAKNKNNQRDSWLKVKQDVALACQRNWMNPQFYPFSERICGLWSFYVWSGFEYSVKTLQGSKLRL